MQLHGFMYKGWRLFYSFPVYLVVSVLHLMFFLFLMRQFAASVPGGARYNRDASPTQAGGPLGSK